MEILGLVFVVLVALAAIILGTRGVFARDLTQALKRVTQQEESLQGKADIIEQRLTQLERDYQAKLKRAEAEADRLMQDAKNQAMNIRTVAMEESKHRARQVMLEAEQGRGQLKSELVRELNGRAIESACETLRGLLPAAQLSSLHAALTAELLEALGRMDVRPIQSAVTRVEVTAAQSLSSVHTEQLTAWVRAAFGPSMEMQLGTDPGLVAGCMVRLGSTVVDSSLRNRIQRAGRV